MIGRTSEVRTGRLRRTQPFSPTTLPPGGGAGLPPAGPSRTHTPAMQDVSVRRTSCLSGFSTPLRRSRSARKALSKLKRLLTPTKPHQQVLQAAAAGDHLARPHRDLHPSALCEETSVWSARSSTCCSSCSSSSSLSLDDCSSLDPVSRCDVTAPYTRANTNKKSLVDISVIQRVSRENVLSQVSTMEVSRAAEYPASSTLMYPLHSTMAAECTLRPPPPVDRDNTLCEVTHNTHSVTSQQLDGRGGDAHTQHRPAVSQGGRASNAARRPSNDLARPSNTYKWPSESTLQVSRDETFTVRKCHTERHLLGQRPEPIGMSAADLQGLEQGDTRPITEHYLQQVAAARACAERTPLRKRLRSHTSLKVSKRSRVDLDLAEEDQENVPPPGPRRMRSEVARTPRRASRQHIRRSVEERRELQLSAKKLYRARKQILSGPHHVTNFSHMLSAGDLTAVQLANLDRL